MLAATRRALHAAASAAATRAVVPFAVSMPDAVDAKIVSWLKRAGDPVKAGEAMCQIETRDVTLMYQSETDGFLAKILQPASKSRTLQPMEKIAMMVASKEELEALRFEELSGDKASPAARHLILTHSVDVSALRGSGKGGRVTKGDVLVALGQASTPPTPHADAGARSHLAPSPPAASSVTDAPSPVASPSSSPAAAVSASVSPATAAAPAPAAPAAAAAGAAPAPAQLSRPGGGSVTDVKPSMVRKVISARLTESKTVVPHFYVTMDCRLDNLLEFRKTLKAAGMSVSVNDVVIKAAARALRTVPEVNCRWSDAKNDVEASETVDVSVAVATSGGLITPIVKDADTLGLQGIADTVRDLANRAKAGKLKPHEFQGGSFTISNLGMFNMDEFTAVINPPQSCILAVGGGVPTAVFEEQFGGPVSDTPVVATIMTVQLSCDRRVVDEVIAAQFLSVFRSLVQHPALLSA